jgi:hypothetical protein
VHSTRHVCQRKSCRRKQSLCDIPPLQCSPANRMSIRQYLLCDLTMDTLGFEPTAFRMRSGCMPHGCFRSCKSKRSHLGEDRLSVASHSYPFKHFLLIGKRPCVQFPAQPHDVRAESSGRCYKCQTSGRRAPRRFALHCAENHKDSTASLTKLAEHPLSQREAMGSNPAGGYFVFDHGQYVQVGLH